MISVSLLWLAVNITYPDTIDEAQTNDDYESRWFILLVLYG